MRILIADNDSEQRSELITFCQQLGHTTEEALNMREVLEFCRKKCPDLCLIDLALSGVSGVEVIKQIRQLGGVAVWNPLILMGVNASTETMRQGIEAGADDFLEKPVNNLLLEYKLNSAKRHESMKDEVFTIAHDLVLSSNQVLENISVQDTMTGIADISKFHKDLEAEWYKAKKENTTLSMLNIDFDDFREYNNIYGSAEGDTRIKQAATTIQKVLIPQCKTFARMAGASFGILMPETDEQTAKELGEKIRQVIEDLQLENKGSHCGNILTVSVGVTSTVSGKFNNPLELMEAADFALYQAKHKGRNKVYFEPAISNN